MFLLPGVQTTAAARCSALGIPTNVCVRMFVCVQDDDADRTSGGNGTSCAQDKTRRTKGVYVCLRVCVWLRVTRGEDLSGNWGGCRGILWLLGGRHPRPRRSPSVGMHSLFFVGVRSSLGVVHEGARDSVVAGRNGVGRPLVPSCPGIDMRCRRVRLRAPQPGARLLMRRDFVGEGERGGGGWWEDDTLLLPLLLQALADCTVPDRRVGSRCHFKKSDSVYKYGYSWSSR